MDLISVDRQQCKRDGVCASVCPLKIIRIKDKDAYPALVRGGEKLCILCGHCLAACPHGALSLMGATPEACPPLRKDWIPDPERTEHFLRSRRSIRLYKKETVEKDVIAKLIDIARYAPSGHNSQPVEWTVINSPGEVRRLTGVVVEWMKDFVDKAPRSERTMIMRLIMAAWATGTDTICWNAPHVIVTHAEKENVMAPQACTIALTYLDLAAPSLGLGTCWAGFFNAAASLWPPMQEALGLPENHAVFGSIMLGYPSITYHRLPPRRAPDITWR